MEEPRKKGGRLKGYTPPSQYRKNPFAFIDEEEEAVNGKEEEEEEATPVVVEIRDTPSPPVQEEEEEAEEEEEEPPKKKHKKKRRKERRGPPAYMDPRQPFVLIVMHDRPLQTTRFWMVPGAEVSEKDHRGLGSITGCDEDQACLDKKLHYECFQYERFLSLMVEPVQAWRKFELQEKGDRDGPLVHGYKISHVYYMQRMLANRRNCCYHPECRRSREEED